MDMFSQSWDLKPGNCKIVFLTVFGNYAQLYFERPITDTDIATHIPVKIEAMCQMVDKKTQKLANDKDFEITEGQARQG